MVAILRGKSELFESHLFTRDFFQQIQKTCEHTAVSTEKMQNLLRRAQLSETSSR